MGRDRTTQSAVGALVASLIVTFGLWLTIATEARADAGEFVRSDTFPAGALSGGGNQAYDQTTDDFNGDGIDDLAVVRGAQGVDNTVDVLLGNGDGTMGAAVSYAAGPTNGASANAVSSGDLDGDGHPDLVVAGSAHGVLLNNGDGTFAAPGVEYQNNSGQTAYAVATGDFTGEGNLDVVTAAQGVRVRFGDGTGELGPAHDPSLFLNYKGEDGQLIFPGVTVADMDGDGLDDIVLSASFRPNGNPGPTFRGAAVMLSNGNGTFATPVFYEAEFTNGITLSPAIGDFDGDGAPDFGVVNDYYQTAYFFRNLNDDSGRVTLTGSQAASGGEHVFADVDRDGDDDRIFVRHSGVAPTGVGVALSNGDGTFSPPTYTDGPDNGVSAGRFNQDNYPDVAATSYNGADNGGILLNQPVDSESPQVTITNPPLGNPHYAQGAEILADYSCSDDIAVASCSGPVADGSPIDTSTAGSKSFQVTAVDTAGHTAVTTHFYVVDAGGGGGEDQAAPQITITTPPLGNPHYALGSAVRAAYSCSDDVAIRSCTGPVASGAPIDTGSVGNKSFKVTAVDTAGHTTTTTHFYVVDTAPPEVKVNQPLPPALQAQAKPAQDAVKSVPTKLKDDALLKKGQPIDIKGAPPGSLANGALQSLLAGGKLISDNGLGVVAAGGANAVAAGGANVVASGGGNVVASGGANAVGGGGAGRAARSSVRAKAHLVTLAEVQKTVPSTGKVKLKLKLTGTGKRLIKKTFKAKGKQKLKILLAVGAYAPASGLPAVTTIKTITIKE